MYTTTQYRRAAAWLRAEAQATFRAARRAARKGAVAVAHATAETAGVALAAARRLDAASRAAADRPSWVEQAFAHAAACAKAREKAAASRGPENWAPQNPEHCARGCYQLALVRGGAHWSGADLHGAARRWGSKYAESRANLAARLRAAGHAVWTETIGRTVHIVIDGVVR